MSFKPSLKFNLKQDINSLAIYIANVERKLDEAHIYDWPDVAKISASGKGLNSTLRNQLNQQFNLPRVYPEFRRIVQQQLDVYRSEA